MKIKWFLFSVALALLLSGNIPAKALTTAPQIAPDKESGYDRSLFKHWIDANKNGCDTRAEVLIAEAIVKPKKDKTCKLTGGKWLSAYDGKTLTDASKLDVDHLVPLAEAWRSGAWAWTAKQRQDYANDLSDSRALIAVTLSTNRSKSDRDISEWVPKIDTCMYVKNWVAIKVRYSLTYDVKEAKSLTGYFETCKFGDIPVQALEGYSYQSPAVQPILPSPIISIIDEKPSVLNIVEVGVPELRADVNLKNSYLIIRQTEPIFDEIGFSCNLQGITYRGSQRNGQFIGFDFFNGKTGNNGVVINLIATPNTYKCFLAYGAEYEAYIFEGTDKGKLISFSDSVKFTIGERIQALPSPTPSPSVSSNGLTVSPGAFCSPAGATGKSANGTAYTCKTSATDTRNRWRP